MKKFFQMIGSPKGALVFSALCVCGTGCLVGILESKKYGKVKPAVRTTNWVGEVAVGAGDKYFHQVGWLPEYQLGLVSDGTVVWRKTP